MPLPEPTRALIVEDDPVVAGMAIEVIDVEGEPLDDEPMPPPAPSDAAVLNERRD